MKDYIEIAMLTARGLGRTDQGTAEVCDEKSRKNVDLLAFNAFDR